MTIRDNREHAGLSFRAKQLIVLAADRVLERLRAGGRDAAEIADELVAGGVLPGCYRARYDDDVLAWLHNATELVRNSLVGDLPHLATTAEQLMARAIFAECRAVLTDPHRPEVEEEAARVGPGLSAALVADRDGLQHEITALEAAAVEDVDALILFDLPAEREPAAHPATSGARPELRFLLFDQWLVPFGNPPRPQIVYDGRASPGPG